jgi:hypothetical protein
VDGTREAVVSGFPTYGIGGFFTLSVVYTRIWEAGKQGDRYAAECQRILFFSFFLLSSPFGLKTNHFNPV